MINDENIIVIGGKDRYKGKDYINTTSRSNIWSRGLSPFFLGKVELYDGYEALNVENGWQYAKLYPEFADENGNPTEKYFEWAKSGWNSSYANRYPMGKGKIPLCSLWKGEKLSYIEARKKIYIPLYAKAVIKTEEYKMLEQIYKQKGRIVLWDFDGYDYHKLGISLDNVINDPSRTMGHAFVLCMLLSGKVKVENNKVYIL